MSHFPRGLRIGLDTGEVLTYTDHICSWWRSLPLEPQHEELVVRRGSDKSRPGGERDTIINGRRVLWTETFEPEAPEPMPPRHDMGDIDRMCGPTV